MSHLFLGASHAANYAKFRPKYNAKLADRIVQYCRQQGANFDLAIDVGCGSGQSTRLLQDHYKKIVGFDVSDEQLKQARLLSMKSSTISYEKGDATRFPVQSDVADLISCAQAYHWLDHDKFHGECERVLRTRGCVAVYGYRNCELDNAEAQKILSHFYSHTMGRFWDERGRHVDTLYREFSLPFGNYTRDDSLSLEMELNLDDFIGYVSTWSAYVKFQETYPDDNHAILQRLHADLAKIYHDESSKVYGTFPLFLLLASKQ